MGDATESAFLRKVHRYRDVLPARPLRDSGTRYRPLVWTSDGREHPVVTRNMARIAALAKAKHSFMYRTTFFLRRWKHEIMVAIQRHRVGMTRCVPPSMSDAQWHLLTGG
eukprot:4903201-Amphidinium_carterae.1